MIAKDSSDLASIDTISYAVGETGLGPALVVRSASGVCAILIGANDDDVVTDLAARFPKSKLVANDAVARDELTKFIRFVDKHARGLDLSLDLRGTPFQRRVWEALRAIPIGTTVTY